jgi:hypothetical protein
VRARSAGDPSSRWLKSTIAAADALGAKKGAPVVASEPPSRHADHAAEAALTLLDEEITRTFDAIPAARRTPQEAARLDEKLAAAIKKYSSPAWVVFATARRGALSEALRASLDVGGARPAALEDADRSTVRHYAAAIALAQHLDVHTAAVARAARRLADLTTVLGDTKMASYVTSATDPATSNALRYEPGMYLKPRGLTVLPALAGRTTAPTPP